MLTDGGLVTSSLVKSPAREMSIVVRGGLSLGGHECERVPIGQRVAADATKAARLRLAGKRNLDDRGRRDLALYSDLPHGQPGREDKGSDNYREPGLWAPQRGIEKRLSAPWAGCLPVNGNEGKGPECQQG